MKYHYCPCSAHTNEECPAWHAIIAIGQHTRMNYVVHGMTSYPLNSTHNRTTSGVTCHHNHCTIHYVRRHRSWHDIIALVVHTRMNDIGHGMPSSPLDSTHGQMKPDVECARSPRTTHTVERYWAWNVIVALGQYTRSVDVEHGMLSSPLDFTHR